ncbi:hypothetical protein C0992_007791 [Termitomyces sp. T32_za158]|nr:hypothetical protein C0992_007791 [Termitomyces sp. T32_za158]
MAEKDATARFRRAVKENNLFLVKRLVERTEMRNIDPSTRRYTSLAWAAVLGHEETFEFLLTSGHDDKELSKDSENNTILMLLADYRPPNVYAHEAEDSSGATLRMARMYYERYPEVLDWTNVQGRTALHIAATKGNEELVRMFCDFGADIDLPDNKGDTPLHSASAWGHIAVCNFTILRSVMSLKFSTKDTLQDTARITVENNKKSRKNLLHAHALADRGNDWNGTSPIPVPPPNLPSRSLSTSTSPRSMTTSIEESESYMGPPSQYAQFPEPPLPNEDASTPVPVPPPPSMIAPIADSDPDPTTQIPWPTGSPRQASDLDDAVKPATPSDDGVVRSAPETAPKKLDFGRRRLTTWNLITLSISMAGAQIAWTVELG